MGPKLKAELAGGRPPLEKRKKGTPRPAVPGLVRDGARGLRTGRWRKKRRRWRDNGGARRLKRREEDWMERRGEGAVDAMCVWLAALVWPLAGAEETG